MRIELCSDITNDFYSTYCIIRFTKLIETMIIIAHSKVLYNKNYHISSKTRD